MGLQARVQREFKFLRALIRTLRLPSTREGFAKVGADVVESTPEELEKLLRSENVKWSKVIRDANVKVE